MKLPTIFRPRLSVGQRSADAIAPCSPAEVAARITRMREAMGIAETFAVPCACARHDRCFSVRFERINPAHRFRIAAIEKDGGDAGSAANDVPRLIELPIDQVDTSGYRCAWCGDDDGMTLCSGCRVFVCRARTTTKNGEDWFACRASCGTQGGNLRPLDRMTGSEARNEPAGATWRQRNIETRLARPRNPSVPLLGRPKR